jgi:WD40 repeat protein
VAFSPNGQEVVTGSDDGTTRLWDISDGSVIGQYVSLPDAWAVLDGKGAWLQGDGKLWKYVN